MKKKIIELQKLRLCREMILSLENGQQKAIVGGSADPAMCTAPPTNTQGPYTGTRYPVESIRNCPSAACNTLLAPITGCKDSIDKCYAP